MLQNKIKRHSSHRSSTSEREAPAGLANQQPRNKTEKRRSNSWAFFQLRQFLEYKGIRDGVRVVKVNPAYTSQTCHHCLHIGLRTDKKFGCPNCGWQGDADYNGAMMIKLVGASVTCPESSELSCPIKAA